MNADYRPQRTQRSRKGRKRENQFEDVSFCALCESFASFAVGCPHWRVTPPPGFPNLTPHLPPQESFSDSRQPGDKPMPPFIRTLACAAALALVATAASAQQQGVSKNEIVI